jgi:hypothetical protein
MYKSKYTDNNRIGNEGLAALMKLQLSSLFVCTYFFYEANNLLNSLSIKIFFDNESFT